MTQGIFSSILIVLLLMAAISDLRSRTIPNAIALIGLALFPLAILVGALPHWPGHLAVGAAAFMVCLGLFAAGAMGGGDAKLIPVMALWVGTDGIATFLYVMALAGGLVALAMLVHRAIRRRRVPAETLSSGSVPYALAIAAGGIAALFEPVLNLFRSVLTGLAASGV
ncbi:MAG: prepilin peptidase [Rhodothalassiaceae bacterium]